MTLFSKMILQHVFDFPFLFFSVMINLLLLFHVTCSFCKLHLCAMVSSVCLNFFKSDLVLLHSVNSVFKGNTKTRWNIQKILSLYILFHQPDPNILFSENLHCKSLWNTLIFWSGVMWGLYTLWTFCINNNNIQFWLGPERSERLHRHNFSGQSVCTLYQSEFSWW